MKTVKVRNLNIGEGIPKICVPIVAAADEEILKEAKLIRTLPADIVEWRADFYAGALDDESLPAILSGLRDILGDTPLIFTFRTLSEGGSRDISDAGYISINEFAIQSGLIDLVDIELRIGDDALKSMIECAHSSGVKVIASSHDFEKTPFAGEIVSRLCSMQDIGADICKIAVMPKSESDVDNLLDAAMRMKDGLADRPYVAISMSDLGARSRTEAERYGSAISFASASAASAPGQIGVSELKEILTENHLK